MRGLIPARHTSPLPQTIKKIVCATLSQHGLLGICGDSLARFSFGKRIRRLGGIFGGRGTAVYGYSGEMAKKRGGGPNTPDGKKNSSRNSTAHGCRSKTVVILDGEYQEDYDEMEREWNDEFGPETYMERRLVKILVDNDWFLQRAVRRLHEAEAKEGNVELMQRYKTSAERSFYRSLNALQQLRKHYMIIEREKDRLKKELEKRPAPAAEQPKGGTSKTEAVLTKAQQLFKGQRNPKKRKKIPILDQWIEIEIQDGKTVTELYPSNEQLIKQGQAMIPAPEMVYRRLHFVNGVPPEYSWTTDDAVTRERGGMGTQRMTVDTWLELIEREEATGTGHVGPCGGNLPRPEERGGCDCETCTHNRAVLEAREGE